MASLEDLRILQTAELLSDEIWERVAQWDSFSKKVVGTQLTRAVDSIGANIAEAFGRFHYGEKRQFLYFARGSLFETKYWLNRTQKRQLLPPETVEKYAEQLNTLARQLNAFINAMKPQPKNSHTINEETAEYFTNL